jgi:hypothetical protein
MLAVQSIWQRPGHRNEERGRVRQTLPGDRATRTASRTNRAPNEGSCRHWPVSVCCSAIIVNIPACERHSLRRLLNAGRLSPRPEKKLLVGTANRSIFRQFFVLTEKFKVHIFGFFRFQYRRAVGNAPISDISVPFT